MSIKQFIGNHKSMKTMDLFSEINPKPRKKRQWLMHVIDSASHCDHEGDGVMVIMQCQRCETETGWLFFRTVTESKRGIPCEKCNGKEGENEKQNQP